MLDLFPGSWGHEKRHVFNVVSSSFTDVSPLLWKAFLAKRLFYSRLQFYMAPICLQVWWACLPVVQSWTRGGGTFSGRSQSLVKVIQVCGTWEACPPGRELLFRTPQFLTEQKMIFLNVSNYICGGVGGEVHKCDCKKNSFRNERLFSAHTSMMMVFHALCWMPPEGLCRKVCFESWTIGCPRLIPPWEKAEPEASLGCGLWTRLLRSPSLSPANMCIQVTDGSKVNLRQKKVSQKDVTCQGGGTVG